MDTNIMWTPCSGTGLEHLHLRLNNAGNVAESIVIGVDDEGTPFRLWYEIAIDHNWHVQRCTLRLPGEENRSLELQADGTGHWTDASGNPLSALDGCLDVDIAVTPFTNTLPIQRLPFTPGQAVDLRVVYLTAPELKARPVRQRYTCLEKHEHGGLYRYESLESGFVRDLPVDEHGLVVDYPGIWKRVEMKPLQDDFSITL
jgi:uncharacterized protein